MKKATGVTVLLWILSQIAIIIYFWAAPQGSDQGAYIKTAFLCFEQDEWYPMQQHIYSYYIWAQGLINFLILQLHLFDTVNLNPIFNMFMNIGILYEVYYLSERFFSKRTAYIAVVAYCLLYSNVMVVLPAGTEVPFLFLTLTAFCLCLSGNIKALFLAGVLFALANWIRPLVVLFLPAVLIYLFYKKSQWSKYIALILPLVLITYSIGSVTEKKIGYFVFQSTTSGVNLIMTANDKAYGGVATSLASDTTSTVHIKDIENYTFVQRDSIWKARSLEWIKENPLQYTKLFGLKLGGLFIEDSWADRPILGGSGFIDQAAHGKKSRANFIKKIAGMAAKSLIYYVIGFLFLYSLYTNRRDVVSLKGLILLILLLGVGATCLFSVSPRYHYPFLFVIVIWAAYGVDQYLLRKQKR